MGEIEEDRKPAKETDKKPAEAKREEETKVEKVESDGKKKAEESHENDVVVKQAPPLIVLGVYMHCEGCARKVRRYLKGFQGVEEVETDCKTHKVVVKGQKADPVKVLERVQRKSHRKVVLLSPMLNPAAAEVPTKAEEKEAPKPEEDKNDVVITVVLKVHMHCEACALEIKKRILKVKGVENVEADLKSSQVTVKGVLEPSALVEYVHKRTGKLAVIIGKVEPDKKKDDDDGEKAKEGSKEEMKKDEDDGAEKEVKKGEEETGQAGQDGGKGGRDEGDGDGDGDGEKAPVKVMVEFEEGGENRMDIKRNEYNPQSMYPQNNYQLVYPHRFDHQVYGYPPQIFSDENPNACSVM